ncbi:MAG: hypothetical protein AB8H86_24450 [Polyangiales bacterium]
MTEFKYRSSGFTGTNVGMGMGVVLILVGVATLSTGGAGVVALPVGILHLVMHVWNRGRAVVTLHDDHLDMKAAPLAGRKLIRYTDISALEVQGKATKIITKDGAVALPLLVLEPEDAEKFVAELKSHITV